MTSIFSTQASAFTISTAVKTPVVAATTADITLSGTQTVDGVSLSVDDRVLVKDQTTSAENGIYVVASTSWQRADDFNGSDDATRGTVVWITDGTENGGKRYRLTSTDPVVVGTSAITWTRDNVSEPFVNVTDPPYNATGDGVTNDTVAIQAAIDAVFASATGGGIVFFPKGTYIVADLKLRRGVSLMGVGDVIDQEGSVLKAPDANSDVLHWSFENPATVGSVIERIRFQGGRKQIVNSDVAANSSIRDCTFQSGTYAIYLSGALKQVSVDRCFFSGGSYGIYVPVDEPANHPNNILDNVTIVRPYFAGQSVSGFYAVGNNSDGRHNWTIINPVIVNTAADGMKITQTMTQGVIINPNCEGIGFGQNQTPPTTGSISSGTSALSVASGTGIANGDTLTIEGAGAFGADLITTVTAGGGTTALTLADNASTTVSGTEVTRSIYSAYDISGTANWTVIGGLLNDGAGGDLMRYSIVAGETTVLLNVSGSRPVANTGAPFLTMIGGSMQVRRAWNIQATGLAKYVNVSNVKATGVGGSSGIAGTPGDDFAISLVDSDLDGTGTFGDFVFYRNPDTVTRELLKLRGDLTRADFYASTLTLNDGTNSRIISGAGSPEGSVTAPVSSLYLRTDGGAGSTLYVKESGSGNTGWSAV